MSDVLKLLRGGPYSREFLLSLSVAGALEEAADEIERLRAERDRYRRALSNVLAECSQEGCDGEPYDSFNRLAYEALSGEQDDE